MPRRLLPLFASAAALWTSAAAAASPAAAGDAGRFVVYDAFASQHVAPRKVVVWLPAGYDRHRDRYAVLYMHDGQNLFDPETSMSHEPWAVDRHLAALERAHAVRPTIVVGIANAGRDRWREYAPAAAVESLEPELRSIAAGDNAGPLLAEAYLRFLVEELKPFIDAHYRTHPERANTVVMGSSMGGLISLYALSRYPDVFGGAGCLSTHWVLTTNPALLAPTPDPRLARIGGAYLGWLRSHLPPPGRHRIYFDHGTVFLDALYAPFQEPVDRMMAELGFRAGVDFESRVYPGATHNEQAWRERIDVPLRFLLRP
jgi:predicted alpha/beta superfamily hydrolase